MTRPRLLSTVPAAVAVCLALVAGTSPAQAGLRSPSGGTGTITVSVTPGHPAATFRPDRALGGGVDGEGHGQNAQIFTPGNVAEIQSAGLRPLTYRLRTELGDEAWHWNPAGTWSDPAHHQGYWTGSAVRGAPIEASYGYFLPRRGNSIDQAGNVGYSRIDDGNDTTFWKSDPYLDRLYTGQPEGAHPQWVVADLGHAVPVDAVRIAWGTPWATMYSVQYWDGSDNPFWVTSPDEHWHDFPAGDVEHGTGGDTTRQVAAAPLTIRFLRVLLLHGSGAAPSGSTDVRDRLGFAIAELGVGTTDANGAFHDVVSHSTSNTTQTSITVSSTDPWHRASDLDPGTEEPGFDRVLRSGLTNGVPAVVPVPVLFGTPDDAAAEIRYLAAIGYPVGRVEVGEEPDGQNVLPEDYGALFVQWAHALHGVNPALALGGPALQTGAVEVPVWADSSGDTAWLHRLSRFLAGRGATADFGFLSVEWYPFDQACPPYAASLASEPHLLSDSFARWAADGFAAVPKLVTEYGYSAFATQAEVDLPGALLNDDFAAQFLTLGGSAAFVYIDDPSSPARNPGCNSWGADMLFEGAGNDRIVHTVATYWAARLLTQTWAEPGDGIHELYPADVRGPDGKTVPVTAYAVRRPDGQWAVLVLNKDPNRPLHLDVRFLLTGSGRPGGPGSAQSFSGPLRLTQYGPAQYRWKAAGANGKPERNQPPAVSQLSPSGAFTAPAYSLSVLVGPGPAG